MDCQHIQELLSAYFDNELSSDVRSSVAQHVQACSRCSDELARFRKLSVIAKELETPNPPPQIWTNIEAELDADAENASISHPVSPGTRVPKRWRLGVLVAAALLLIATGGVWIASQILHPPGHPGAMAADFGTYLDDFYSNPNRAQKALLAKYDGQAVNLTLASRQLGYRPAVSSGLPKRYTVDGVYVLKMPCCNCVQTICRRDDGKVFAIFEHDEQQPVCFGDRPTTEAQCRDCQCQVTLAKHGLVASWNADRRQMTVVGARDLDDIADLVSYFHGKRSDS